MTMLERLRGLLARSPLVAAAVYTAVIALFVFVAADRGLDVLRQKDAAEAAADLLQRMESRDQNRSMAVHADVSAPAGSPFLEGTSASIAGAALLQRMTSATARLRGNVLSSQVDLQGPQSKAGFITATTSFEIEPAFLQPLLYDLEAGMPFLFIDQLVVQAPSGVDEGRKLRVLLAVSGQWQGKK